MRHFITFLFFLCAFAVKAQTTPVVRPPKPQTTTNPAPKPTPAKPSKTEPQHPAKPAKPTPRPSKGNVNGHEWVDLGLSVKWATMNVGATSPRDGGGYFAWGETRTKSSYTWSTCFDCLDNSGNSWGIYKLLGGQTSISPTSGHDTARENWGSGWRMPTDAETEELCTKCTWKWTSKNGRNGYLVTGPNGNSIFLPAAGYRYGKRHYCIDTSGNYWSNTLSTSYSNYAHYLYFDNCRYNEGTEKVPSVL